MLFEIMIIVLSGLPYLLAGVIYYKISTIIKVMSLDLNGILNNLDSGSEVPDEVDTPKAGMEQNTKREALKDVINQGKAHLLPGKKKWSLSRLDKSSDEVIDKLYDDYTQAELQYKAEKTGKAVGKHIVNLYSNGIDRVLKIDSVENLRRDINEDPIIKDSMADIGALMVGTFGKMLAPMLVACHTVNHTKGFSWEVETEDEDKDT